jgi:hypothetical protein
VSGARGGIEATPVRDVKVFMRDSARIARLRRNG